MLLGNLLVNITFYAIVSDMALEIGRGGEPIKATIVGVLSPLIIIVLGDVTPKVVALGFTDLVATSGAPLLWLLKKLMWPLRAAVIWIAKPFSAVLVDPRPKPVYVTPEELKMLISTSESQGLIDRKEGVMMRELVDFGKVLVREVMVPRVDVVMFQKDRPVSELIGLIRATGHSRIPVFGRSQDDVLGIIDGRDVFLNPGKPVMEMVNKVYYVPETKTVESLLSEFRHLKKTSAIVVDEYGGTAGLVALEDAVEAIVGELHDEYDKRERAVRVFGENSYLLSGRVPVSEWAEMFDIDVEDRRPATLGGLVIMLLGHLPREGEQASYSNVRFTITRVRGHCIEEVLVEIVEPAKPSEPAGGEA